MASSNPSSLTHDPAHTLPRPATVAAWLLRLALLAHAIALFAIVLGMRQTQFGNFLFLELFDPTMGEAFFGFRIDDPYMAAVWIERLTVSLYLLLGLAVVLQPFRNAWLTYALLAVAAAVLTYRYPVFPTWELAGAEISLAFAIGLVVLAVMLWLPMLIVLPIMCGYAIAESLSGTWFGGYRFNEWTIYSDMLRWGTPLVLLFLIALPSARWIERFRMPAARDLLRVLIAAVFFFHGLQAWLANPGFVDLILGTIGRTFDPALAAVGIATETNLRISESTAVALMKVIAIVDFAVALAVLVYPRPVLVPQRFWKNPCANCAIRRVILPALLLWLAFWGLITALSRLTALGLPLGLEQYPELLIRAAHYLGPLALWGLALATYWPATRSQHRPGDAGAPAVAEPALPGAEALEEPEPAARTT